MKNFFLPAVIVSILACCTSRDKSGENSILTEAEVNDFIAAYDAMWRNRDTDMMKEAMSENYIYFTSTGKTTDRNTILSWFTPADKYRVDTSARTEISISIQGNTAIVSSRWTGNGSFAGERFEDDQRCGLVIKKENGRLLILSEHCVQIAR